MVSLGVIGVMSFALHAGLEDDLLNELAAPKNSGGTGDYLIVLVGPDGKPIEDSLYLRSIPGQYSANVFPRVFMIEGKDLFTGGLQLTGNMGSGASPVSIRTDVGEDTGQAIIYRPESHANMEPGGYAVGPFGLRFNADGGLRAQHPALSVERNTLKIHCVPVTFTAVDKKKGYVVPLRDFMLTYDKTELLGNIVPDEMAKGAWGWCPLTIYLPRGLEYNSSAGRFSITDDGRIVPGSSSRFKDGRFVIEVDATAKAPPPVGKGAWVFSQSGRRVFSRSEVATFQVVLSGQFAAGNMDVIARTAAGEHVLGSLSLPAVDGVDSVMWQMDMSVLPPGTMALAVKHASAQPYEIQVVDLIQRTPLVLQSVACCNGASFGMDPEGLAEMSKNGMPQWVSYGHGSMLAMTKIRPVSVADGAPSEMTMTRPNAAARQMLEDTLAAGMTMIDYANRRLGFYNEGLAFHHSYQPNVDRMHRRTHIFAQELQDYPAFAGLTYTWFPCLGGYTEGGVPDDPYFGTRMEALYAIMKEKDGLEPIPWQERWTKLHNEKTMLPPGPERKALVDRQREFYRVEQARGFGDTLAERAKRLKEIRADFIATTSENNGHDAGKLIGEMARGLDAMSMESYTDYGDWPASTGWSVDWAKAVMDKPYWFCVDGTQEDTAILTKAMYAFARGADGIGIPMVNPGQARSNRIRGKGIEFFTQYGALVTEFTRESAVAVLSNEVQHNLYDCHSLYTALMRLGHSPIVLSERTVESPGIPAFVKVVMIPRLDFTHSDATVKGLTEFMNRGGKVVIVGPSKEKDTIPGAIFCDVPLKNLWDVGGFPFHKEFWDAFQAIRPGLEKTCKEVGLVAAYGAQPDKALIMPMRAGGMTYVAVITSLAGERDTSFYENHGVEVAVGEGKTVVNLVTGETLAVQGGKVTFDLIGEPFALLALLDKAPAGVTLKHPAKARANDLLELSAVVKGLPAGANAPVEYMVTDPSGTVRATLYRLANGEPVTYRLAGSDVGAWSVTARELLTGLSATAKIPVEAAAMKASAAVPEVFIPHPDRLVRLAEGTNEIRVMLEETQGDFEPLAQQIVDALTKAGRKAVIQRVDAASFDTLWLRYWPRKAEEEVLAKIDAGTIVGYRGQMRSYIDRQRRVAVAERGGWSDLAPLFIVRTDVILFSGGRLSDSLKEITDWMDSPSTPGKGRGMIEVCPSAFWADKAAVAVIAHDDAGRKKAVDTLIAGLTKAGMPAGTQLPEPAIAKATATTEGNAPLAMNKTLKGFVPPSLVRDLIVSDDGFVGVRDIRDTMYLYTPDLKPIRKLSGQEPYAIAQGGRYVWATLDILQKHEAWHFVLGWAITLNTVDNGSNDVQQIDTVDKFFRSDGMGDFARQYAISNDGKQLFAGRFGGGWILFDMEKKAYRVFSPDTRQAGFMETFREGVRPTSVRFSPGGKMIAMTMANQPTGYGGMMGPPSWPVCNSVQVVDVATGKTLWRQVGKQMMDCDLAAMNGCIAVSDDAKVTALITWRHDAVIFDETGKEVFRQPIFDWKKALGGDQGDIRSNPLPLRVAISADAGTVLFASATYVMMTDGDGGNPVTVPVPSLSDAALSADGKNVYAIDLDGLLFCLDRSGKEVWQFQTSGTRNRVATVSDGVLVAEGSGNVQKISRAGKSVASAAMDAPAADDLKTTPMPLEGPGAYVMPETLARLVEHADAKQAAEWKPQGNATTMYGRKFYPVDAPLTLSANGKGSYLVHMVYRYTGDNAKTKLAAADSAKVKLEGGYKPREFVLDLSTPEYRCVNLPMDAKEAFKVTVTPVPGMEISELSVHRYTIPGHNGAFIKTADSELLSGGDSEVGISLEKPEIDLGPAMVLNPNNPTEVARAHSGRMKNVSIYSVNMDPDKVQGMYYRTTGNALECFDGLKYSDNKCSAWTPWSASGHLKSAMGSRIVSDLGYKSRPTLCLIYERSMKQSEVMDGLAVMGGAKATARTPEAFADFPLVIDGVLANDQFFHVLRMAGSEFEVLCVFAFGQEKDHGFSEVELSE